MILEEIQKFYKLFLENQIAKNLSKNSIDTYNRVFDKFYDFLASENEIFQLKSLIDINNAYLASYLLHLESLGLGSTTRKLHVTVIKQFFWFIADSDLEKYEILKSRVTGIKVKTIDKEVDVYTDSEQQKIIATIKLLDKSKNFRDHRISLILKLLLFHGVRINELISLKWENIEEIEDEVYGCLYKFWYMGKGSKERDLDIPMAFVQKNFDVIKNHGESPYVIPGSTGEKSFRNSIYNTIRILLNKQGIKNVTLHKFRHTFGHNKVNEGVNSITITELMGHANPIITHKFYLRNNKKAKKSAILSGLPDQENEK